MKNVVRLFVKLVLLLIPVCVYSQITFENVSGVSGIKGSFNTSSVSINDVDSDGDEDLFVVHNSGTQMYYNNGYGVFSDTTNVASLGAAFTMSAQLGDIDNDGDLDIVIAGENSSSNLKIYRNDGLRVFTDITTGSGIGLVSLRVFSLALIDYNHDGFLDVFCAALGNQNNRLYKNLGNGTFTDCSSVTGISVNSNARGIATGDIDSDGDIDIFIPNSGRANVLFRNDNGVFTDIAVSAGVAFPNEDNHGAQFADYDNDGDPDLLIGIGGGPYRLLKNNGSLFTEVTVSAGISLGSGICLGASFSDFDNDGDLDLVAQVHVAGKRIALFSNDGDGTFTDVSSTSNFHNTSGYNSNTLATGDYNNDGKVDVYIGEAVVGATGTIPDFLYKNTTGSANKWIRIKLQGTISNKSGIGARISLYANGKNQNRQLSAGNGYNNQHSLIQHFGLGNATMIDSIIVEWPSGIRQIKKSVNVNQLISISETETSDLFTKITTGSIVNDGGRSFGAAWGDYDNDGYADLFVANVTGGNNFLYKNNGDGSFNKITSGTIVNDGGSSESCSWGDYNNDGYIDLYVTNYPNSEDNFLYKNNGNGTFTKITSGPHIQDNGSSYTCSWIDFDNDGRLDLFVTNDWGENNSLFRNNGDETFSEITSGTVVNDGGNSLGCAWSDYDNDGDQDLFVANWNSQNNFLYRNNGNGTFIKETSGPVVNDGKSSTGGSWGDFNNDGYMDLFVANDHYENNLLYVNNGDGTFNQITTGDIVNDGGKSVGSSWGDFDNDGLLDLYVVNIGAKNFLYRNNGDGTFNKITTGYITNDVYQSRGCTWIDYNNDGFLDMFVSNDLYENNNLYRNNGKTNHWLKLTCIGTTSNKSAIGTKIQIKSFKNNDAFWQTREISGQTGYCSQNDLTVHFGIADAQQVDTVIIHWPSGIHQVLTNVPCNQHLTVVEQSSSILQLSMDTVNVLPDNSGFLTLSLSNSMRISAMEFSFHSDVSELNLDSITLSDRAENMEFLYNPATRKIVIYSSSQSFIETGNGSIAKLYFSFDETGNTADTTVVNFANTLVAGTDNEPLTCAVYSGMILTIRKGDVNADGRIDVLDVQETARIIVGLPVTDYPDYPTKLYLADANPYPEGDGVVNIFDLNKIIQLSLTFGFGDSTAGLVYKTSGAVDSMPVILNNTTAISALQFDLEGAAVSSFRLQNLPAKFKAVYNGKRIVIYSPDGLIEPGQKIIGKIIFSPENGSTPKIQNPVAGTQTGIKVLSSSNGNTVYTKSTVNNPDDSDLPKSFELYQNYPNPFNPTTKLSYKILNDGEVSLRIYNMLGQEIKTLVNGFQAAGEYQYQWNGLNNSGQSVGSGVYIYTLKSGKSFKSRKMIYLK